MGRRGMHIENIDGKARNEEITRKTKTQMGG
jgi:hypothetical protein